MNTEISAATMNRVAALAHELFAQAPPIALRELLEAALGFRAARIQVSRRSLSVIRDLASRHGFGMAAAAHGLLIGRNPSLGDWADGEGTVVDCEHPDALINVYFGADCEIALCAKVAEETFDDEAFGRMLGIPVCCRRSYDRWMSEGRGAGMLTWLPVEATPWEADIPAGSVFLGRYFGHGLISHFPCNLLCAETRRLSRERLEVLELVHRSLAASLSTTHHWNYLVIRGKTVAAFPSVQRSGDGSSLELRNGVALNGTLLPARLGVVTNSGHLTFSSPVFGMEEAHVYEARLVSPRLDW